MFAFLIPLLAVQIEDLIKLLPLIVFALVWLWNRLFAGEGNPAQQQRPKVRRPEPPQPKPVAAPRERANDEVAEFLRRAQQPRGAPQEQPAAPRIAEPLHAEIRRLQPAAATIDVVPVEVEIVEEQRLGTGSGVAAHVEQRIGSRKLRERPTGEVDQADEVMAAHLHQAFDHKLGQFANTMSQTATTTPAIVERKIETSARVAAILSQMRNPTTVGNAILVAEVLRRPEERW